METFQKIFSVGIILSAIIAGNKFAHVNNAGGTSTGDPSAFSASGNPALLGSAANIAGAEPDASSDISNKNDSLSSSGTSAPPVFYRFGNDPPPVVQAHAALVEDLQTGETYFQLNRDGRWPMASITKLMTAALVLKTMDQNKILTLGAADVPNGSETEFFKPGLSYSVRDILKVMLLLSNNDAAEALANAYSPRFARLDSESERAGEAGGRSAFIDGLNGLAAEWGLGATHVSDPTGLSIANQSIAENIAALALRIYRDYPEVFATTGLKSAAITETNSKKKTIIANINQFAGRADFLGGKTGYTDEADGNLLSIFSYGRRPVVIVVFGTDDRFGETGKLFEWFKNNFRASR